MLMNCYVIIGATTFGYSFRRGVGDCIKCILKIFLDFGELGRKVQAGAAQAADTMREGYKTLEEGYREAERVVQERPGQALALAFGLGLAAGIGVALLFRERSSESAFARGRAASEQFGRQVLDALSSLMPQR